MTEKEKIMMLEEVLELDKGEITSETKLDEIPEYNSMTKLALIVMMQDKFGVELDSVAVRAFRTIGDILAKMEK